MGRPARSGPLPQVPVIELGEWESIELPDRSLTHLDRDLAATLSASDGRLVVEELRQSLRIRASSWVGEVRFEHFVVRVVPKLVGGHLGVLRMLDYASGLDALARFPAVRDLAVAKRGSLVDLLGLLLAESCDRIIRDGLLQDYVVREETLSSLRGRLLYDRQIRQRFGRLDRLECRYDEFESDILENRILAKALGIARRICSDEGVRAKVNRAHGVFDAACDSAAFDPQAADLELVYQRRNEHYRSAHALGSIFFRQLAVHDLYASGATRSFVFLLDMNRLFEDFVTRLLIDAFEGTDVQVRAQPRDRSLLRDELTGRPYAAVIPDVLLERRDALGRRRVPIDAKYKLYDERKLEPADVYQTFFYAYAYARPAALDSVNARAFIVYPASRASVGRRLRVQDAMGVSTASIHAIPLDVPAALDAVRQRRQVAELELATRVGAAVGFVSVV
jgi:5-methylcytosine-specific restriction enzyme subunit McrC